MIKGLQTIIDVLTGVQPVYAVEADPEVEVYPSNLDLSAVADYNELDFPTLVAQGRARLIEWYAIKGQIVGFDHDLMVFVMDPGAFPGSR